MCRGCLCLLNQSTWYISGKGQRLTGHASPKTSIGVVLQAGEYYVVPRAKRGFEGVAEVGSDAGHVVPKRDLRSGAKFRRIE